MSNKYKITNLTFFFAEGGWKFNSSTYTIYLLRLVVSLLILEIKKKNTSTVLRTASRNVHV